jgi:two-component system, NtrC family, response regulator PilR
MSKSVVLSVDDEPDLLDLFSFTLSRIGLDTRTAGDVAAPRRLVRTEHLDLSRTDMRLPDGDGLCLVEWIQREPAIKLGTTRRLPRSCSR